LNPKNEPVPKPGNSDTDAGAERKREEDRQDTRLAVENTRRDAEHKREEDRQDTRLAVENTRQDAEHKREEDRQDTRLAVENTRQDAEHKRVDDREDTQLALKQARWDTDHKRDEDREDTQLALKQARWDTDHKRDEDREDAQLAINNARWDAEHARDEDRKDTADALQHSREDAAIAVEWTLFEAAHAAYITTAQNSLASSLTRANYVITAAGSIVTLYTGLLALQFSPGGKTPLPARSIFPALFLGGAVAFATFYVAFLRPIRTATELLPSGLGGDIPQKRLLAYMDWCFAGVLARAWSLRLAVISLALGLALLPVGFVQLSTTAATDLVVGAGAILVAWIVGEVAVYIQGPLIKPRQPRPRQPAPPNLATGLVALPVAPQPGEYPPTPVPRSSSNDPPPGPMPVAAQDPPPGLAPVAPRDPSP